MMNLGEIVVYPVPMALIVLRRFVALSILVLVTPACSGGSGSGNGKPAEGTKSGDAGSAGARSSSTADKNVAPGADDEAHGVRWKNRPLPPDATPREIDVATHLEVDPSDATPDVLCAVKLDKPEDGPEVRKRARALRVPMLILAYNWIIDWRKDGQFDEQDKQRFAKWIDINIAPNSRQLVVIDYEHPYWPEFHHNMNTSPERLAQIAAVYREIYAFAKARRPKARWGFFGLPRPTNVVNDEWKARTHQISELILKHTDVVYLTIYDRHPGDRNGRDLEVLRSYVEFSLAEAGPRPVYAFARGRYFGMPPHRDEPIPEDEFRAHIGAALDARWRDGNREHKLAGVILWDGNLDKRPKPATKEELDKMFAGQLNVVQDTVRKRRPSPGSNQTSSGK